MSDFQYVKVSNLNEIYQHVGNENRKIKILAGGTDLIPQLKDQLYQIDKVIDVKEVEDLTKINFDETSGLYLGAAVSCKKAKQFQILKSKYQGLVDAISLIGGVQIQGRATIGGNLCNASPAADAIPALIVHDAVAIISSAEGTREVHVSEFCTGPRMNVLKNNEVLVGLQIPSPKKGFGASYQRFIPRNEMDIAVVGVASAVTVGSDREIKDVKIALGAVAPTPLKVDSGSMLVGVSLDDPNLESKIEEVGQQTATLTSPITDMRGSAAQRKHLVSVLTKREILNAIKRAKLSLEA